MTSPATDTDTDLGLPCQHCQKTLYGELAFCPFCGNSTRAAPGLSAPVAAPPPAPPAPPELAPTPATPATPAPDEPAAPPAPITAPITSPVQAPQPLPPSPPPLPLPPTAPPPARPRGGKAGGIIAAVLIGAAGLAWWQWGTEKTLPPPDACAIALEQAHTASTNGAAPEVARNTAQTAVAACQDPARAQQAQALLQAANAQLRQRQPATPAKTQKRPAPAAAPLPPAVPVPSPAPVVPVVPTAPTVPATAATDALVQDFLKDAQTHLQRQQFDKAKAFAESAARIAPNNADVVRMKRKIQQQELQYLRDNITIE